MKTKTIAGHALVPDPNLPGNATLRRVAIEVSDGVIKSTDWDVDLTAVRGGDGGNDHLIIPGMVDCHVHLPQFDIIGGHGMPLLRWLEEVTFPAEQRWSDVDFAASMVTRVIDQLMAVGTTSIAAYATNHAPAAGVALRLATTRGLRGVIGHVLMDRNAPPSLCQNVDDQIDQSATLLAEFPPMQSMAAAVTPRFAVSCTGELLARAGELCRATDARVQTHLSETEAECEFIGKLFDGQSYVDVYDQCGLVRDKSLFGHGIYLDQRDHKTLASARSSVAHCPTANRFLRSGQMDRAALVDASVGLCLGSDIGAGFERSMVRVARSMILTADWRSPPPPTAPQAWWQITYGNATTLGLADYGLRAGAAANFAVVCPNIAWRNEAVDPLSRLMFAWDDRWIDRVYLDHRQINVRELAG